MKTNLGLIHDYALGIDEALGVLFCERDYYWLTYFKAYKQLGRFSREAEDVVQNVILALLEKPVPTRIFKFLFRPESNFRNYVLTMAGNKAIDLIRKLKNVGNESHGEKKPVAESGYPAVSDAVREARNNILERARRLYEQNSRNPDWDIEDLKYLELFLETGPRDIRTIVEKTGKTAEEIRTIKQRIKRRLEKHCPDCKDYLNLLI